MAFSATKKSEQLIGGLKIQVWDLNFASVTSGQFKTGMIEVHAALFNNGVTEDQGLIKKNRNSDDSAREAGSVLISGVTSNDTGELVVIGA